MRRGVLPLLFILGAGAAARAAEDDAAWKKEMESKIEVLTREIERLKLSGAPAPAPAGQSAASSGTAAIALSRYSFGPAAGKVYSKDHGISLGGYGELIYQNFAHSTADSINGDENEKRGAELNLARMVLYAGYRFSDSIVFNSELEVEHANSSKSGEASAEFAYLDFHLSQPLGLRVGKMLLPVGLTNEYHEPTVFHGSLRPDVEQFLIPTTWSENGAGFYGEFADFAYRGYLVAGLRAARDGAMNQTGFQPDIGIREGRQEGSRSRAHDLGYAQRLDYVGIPGWVFGGSVYCTNAGQGDLTPAGEKISAPLTMWEAHWRGEYRGFETRALYTQTTIGGVNQINQVPQANGLPLTGNQSVGQFMWGAYVEISYDVMPLIRPKTRQYVSPFFRFERYNTQQEVPRGYARNGASDRAVYTMGASYKPIPNVVLKGDFQIRDNKSHTGVNGFTMAAGYEF